MSINLATNVACPLTMVTNHLEVAMFDEVILHVAEHGGGTRAHATCGETVGVKLDIGVVCIHLHNGGEVSGKDVGEESTIRRRGELIDIFPNEQYDIERLAVRARIAMSTAVGRTTLHGILGCVLEDVERDGCGARRKYRAMDSWVEFWVFIEAEEGLVRANVVSVG